ncbi:MAG: class II aldolase/adducin family protein, partial [Halobacteriovoraceae bacterium]|nr:class II aldolase/adducin family protein [Halobacteriovoraceae bacterium]
MCPIDDGVIKYDRTQFEQSDALETDEFSELEKWRETLYNLKLIGEYLPEKIGYGNLSQKKNYLSHHNTKNPQFIITATQTGGLKKLDGNTYTRVLDYDLEKQLIKVKGPMEASSEALTHAAVYKGNEKITTVFHIHNKEIWKGMIENSYDGTPKEVPYGTKEMADAVSNLIKGKNSGL